MTSGLHHILHSSIIGIILYIIMIFFLGQNSEIALNRSILIFAIVLIYMIIFGHGFPNQLNPNL
jgi:heme/copper-type cytochrome/quinol oxidase subunit 4